MWIWDVWVCVMTAALVGGAVMVGVDCNGPPTLESSAADLTWLLVQESPPVEASQQTGGATGGQQQQQITVRRITPKSVFLAPTFTSCSDGYRQDSLGRCVKIVKVNPSAQWDFFLQKLNSMYGPPSLDSTKKNKPSTNTGPFRLPIPLATEPPAIITTASTTTTEQTTTTTESTTPPTTTTLLSTTIEEQTTDPPPSPPQPFLIVVANTTQQYTTSTTDSTTTTIIPTPSTTITEPTTITTTEQPTITTTAPSVTTPSLTTILYQSTQKPQQIRSTIIFPDSKIRQRRPPPVVPVPVQIPAAASSSSSYIRFPETQQQAPSAAYWLPPHSWEHRLWQHAYPPRQQVYHNHREARPAW